MSEWIGVDLDGTLAEYHGWVGPTEIGAPIPKMVARVQHWLNRGIVVKIFTARMCTNDYRIKAAIQEWCLKHIGLALEVTNQKDFDMLELWDDRAVQIIPNTGERADRL